jgi:hypothetical protein
MAEHSAWAYPWDVLEDPSWADTARSAGLGSLSVATAYHSVRALAPRLADRRVVQVSVSGTYFSPDEARYGAIQPNLAEWSGPADALEQCLARASEEQVAFSAWLVVCHSSGIGRRYPAHTMRNAFGDRYDYALCPSSPDVREYAAALAADVTARGVSSLHLEACGPIGYEHGSHHEKSRDDLGETAKLLLSLCFCDWCIGILADEHGLDVADLQCRVRAAADHEVAYPRPGGAAVGLRDVLGENVCDAILAVRTSGTLDLVAGVRGAVGDDVRISMIGNAEPVGGGGVLAAGHPDLARSIDALIVPLYGVDETADIQGALRSASTATGVCVEAGIAITAPDAVPSARLENRIQTAAEAGVDAFHHYHFGLATESELLTLGHVVAHQRTTSSARSSAPLVNAVTGIRSSAACMSESGSKPAGSGRGTKP